MSALLITICSFWARLASRTVMVMGVVSVVLLAGCASERVTLLPAPDGTTGAVYVKGKREAYVIDKPYTKARVGPFGRITNDVESSDYIQKEYAPVIAARPKRPVSYIVYFLSGSDELTPESQAEVTKLQKELVNWPVPEITVIGHTDRVGSVKDNDELSMQRAERMRSVLIAAGINPKQLEIAARGEREPLVPTADEVAEPKNRRVEINIR